MKPHFPDYLQSFVLSTLIGLAVANTAHAESIPTGRQKNLPSASSLVKESSRLALETSGTASWNNANRKAKPGSNPVKKPTPTITPGTQAYNNPVQKPIPAITPGTQAYNNPVQKPIPATTPGTQAYNSISPSSISNPVLNSLNAAVYKQVNEYRQARNLPPLVVDPAISAIAQAHSELMAKEGGITHDGFNQRVDSISKTIVYRNAAENVGYNMGYAKPDAIVVQDWIESPGHQRNMVGNFDLTGIGIAKNARGEYYFTQIFIRKAFYTKDAD
jgi:uncharacterized protein YkwD